MRRKPIIALHRAVVLPLFLIRKGGAAVAVPCCSPPPR